MPTGPCRRQPRGAHPTAFPSYLPFPTAAAASPQGPIPAFPSYLPFPAAAAPWRQVGKVGRMGKIGRGSRRRGQTPRAAAAGGASGSSAGTMLGTIGERRTSR